MYSVQNKAISVKLSYCGVRVASRLRKGHAKRGRAGAKEDYELFTLPLLEREGRLGPGR